MDRRPVVAGQFYPADAAQLKAELERFIPRNSSRAEVLGIIAPHAGYVYSGAVAGAVYGRITIPETVIILGPNHHGRGARAALYPDGTWTTPLGTTQIHSELANLLISTAPMLERDTEAHLFEHSLEVQLPFLQCIRQDVTIVPICLGFGDFNSCAELGEGIAAAIRQYDKDVLIVASSDMTHYESAESAARKDQLAFNEVTALNPSGLLDVCRSHRITMCGVIPAAVMLVAAKLLGATRSDLVRYATSGDVTGDNRQVVGYAGFTVS
jgi:AmmeMemoRadiSam system protein B